MMKNNKNKKTSERQVMLPDYPDQIGSLVFDSVEFSVVILESDFSIAWHNDYFLEWSAANNLNCDNLIKNNASDVFPFWEDVLLPMCEKSLSLKQPTSFDNRIWISNTAHILKGNIIEYSKTEPKS